MRISTHRTLRRSRVQIPACPVFFFFFFFLIFKKKKKKKEFINKFNCRSKKCNSTLVLVSTCGDWLAANERGEICAQYIMYLQELLPSYITKPRESLFLQHIGSHTTQGNDEHLLTYGTVVVRICRGQRKREAWRKSGDN